jgi:peroxiredoxin-like protein
MESSYTYTASVEWTGQRKGRVSSEGLTTLEVATPAEFPGGHEGYWSPESYLVASVTSCIMNTFLAIAGNSKLEIQSFTATGTGTMEQRERSYEFTRVDITVSVGVADEETQRKASRMVEKAEQNCFISRSLKADVHVTPEVSVVG